jgi:hypothetical protein
MPDRSLHLRTVNLNPTGADGTAAASALLNVFHAGFIRAIEVVYTNQVATTALTIRGESATGPILFASGATATNIGPAPLAFTGVNQANAAVTAVSLGSGGAPFKKTLSLVVATSNVSTNGAKVITVRLWLEY